MFHIEVRFLRVGILLENIMRHEPKELRDLILRLPRIVKQLTVALVDVIFCIATVIASYFLRLDAIVALEKISLLPIIVSILLALPIFLAFGLYKEIFRFSGLPALISVVKSVLVYLAAYSLFIVFIGIEGVPRTIGIIQPLLLLLAVSASRLLAASFLNGNSIRSRPQRKLAAVLIYGAGVNGRHLAEGLLRNNNFKPVGFIDDDIRIQNQVLNGIRIYAPKALPALTKRYNIKYVFLAIPNARQARRNEIINNLQENRVSVRTLPSLSQLTTGNVTVSDLRELDVNDLLGRQNVEPIQSLLEKNITEKVVLVTGAGGSIGAEICRQICNLKPMRLILVEQTEYSLYAIHQELEGLHSQKEFEIVPIIGSVQDSVRMKSVFTACRPETIFHAAAYKHVPLVEQNLYEGVKNNIFGTLTIANLAIEYDVESMVLISSDKAVRPTNAMGATKRMSELCLQALNEVSETTTFSIVRFGNVLGSSGSVVPRFRKQIQDGGPITLTHSEITRFFMTIPEAAQLVIQAGAMSSGGEIYVLDMGEPVKIKNLAYKMVQLSGLTVKDQNNPDGDIEISITGLRPGEKLFEELLIDDEAQPTAHFRIMKAQDEYQPWVDLKQDLDRLLSAVNEHDLYLVKNILSNHVEGYSAEWKIHDHLHRKDILDRS